MKKKITIIDYGIGNILSIKRALEKLGEIVVLSKNKKEIVNSSHIILPGVGAFGEAMKNLKKFELEESIKTSAKKGNFILGICLGMQMLLKKSYEFGEHKGINLIEGEVCKIKEDKKNKYFKLPYIGWNSLIFRDSLLNQKKNNLLNNIKKSDNFYFIHSYEAKMKKNSNVLAKINEQGKLINAIIFKENIYGCQFHPEKSRESGLTLLKNFVNLS